MEPIGYVYLALLSLQFGSQPLLTRKFVSPEVLTSMMVLFTELSKAIIALSLILMQRPKILKTWTIRSCLVKAGLPAATYAIQNQSNYAAMRNLDGVTYTVLNQTKIVSTALCLYIVMGVKPTIRQLLGMVLVMIAVFLVITVEEDAPPAGLRDERLGLFSGVMASLLSGLGAALSQRTLQREKRDSVLFSGELGFLSGVIQAATMTCMPEVRGIWLSGGSLLVGFQPWTGIPLVTQACGGFMVGQVTKHAGSVAKGYTVVVGIILTIILKSLLESRVWPHHQVFMAVLVISLAVYLQTSPGSVRSTPVKKE